MATIEEAVEVLAAKRKTVAQAVAAVMAELPSIGKDDKSPEGYTYRGIEAVTKQVQPLFAKHGVVVVPRAQITDVRPSPAMKDGWTDVYMQVEWTIAGPDGSTLTAQTTGIGRDRADKGANKAQTQAFKYLLLHLLCIADGKDDSDGQSYDHAMEDAPDQAACPSCGEIIQGARSDKEPMRRHMVDAHGWVRNEDGTVAKPKGSEVAGTSTGPVPEGSPADLPADPASPSTDPPVGDGTLDDPKALARPEDVERVMARILLLKDVEFVPFMEGEGVNFDELTVYNIVELESHLVEWEARAEETPAQRARREAREKVAS